MIFVRKQKMQLALFLYWVLNAANTMNLSREPGYYPPRVREQAQLLAQLQPYPWPSIFATWVLLAILTGGIYLILNHVTRKVTCVLVFTFFIAFIHAIVIPTDIGGVHYAISEFATYTFIGAICIGVYKYLRQRLKPKVGHN
jgi:hypothetical protein